MKTRFDLIIGITLTILLAACQKDNNVIENKPSCSTLDNPLVQTLNNFLTLKSKTFKNEQLITVDSALWLIEAGANYTYGHGNKQNLPCVTDSVLFALPVHDSGIVETGKAYLAYQQMIENVRNQYRQITSHGKYLVALQVKKELVGEERVVLKALFQVALESTLKSTSTVINDACYFNDVDWWHWYSGGICDGPNAGLFPEKSMASEMQRHINNCIPVPGEEYWYSDIVDTIIMPSNYPNPDFTGGYENYNYCQYKLYWNCSLYPNCHTCISPIELAFYLSNGKWVINTSNQNGGARPPRKSFISVKVWDTMIAPLGSSIYIQMFEIKYGILHIGGLGTPLD